MLLLNVPEFVNVPDVEIVPELHVIVPAFVISPETVNVLDPFKVTDDPEAIERLLHTALALTIGLFVTLGIETPSDAVGTVPFDQFVAVFQSVLVVPDQTFPIFRIPVAAEK